MTSSEFSYSVPPPAAHLLSSGNATDVEGLQVSEEEMVTANDRARAEHSTH